MGKYNADPYGLDKVCEDGLYLGSPDNPKSSVPVLGYSLRDLYHYVEERNLFPITQEIIDQARKDGAI